MPDRPAHLPISVILPICRGSENLDRAIRSVTQQSFPDWELLIVDCCSTEADSPTLRLWPERDARIRLLRIPPDKGQSAARNFALEQARGEYICYLDDGDEFYLDHFAKVSEFCGKCDVLVFQYDLIDDGASGGVLAQTWHPEAVRDSMFLTSIARPLGVVHRRSLVEWVGGFNELLWMDGEADLWRRFARAGAEFQFVTHKSGRHYVRATGQSDGLPTRKHLEMLDANYRAGKPLFGDPPKRAGRRPIKKIAFVSPHCVVDSTNGAAVATWAGLKTLAGQGFECQAFCATRFDAAEEGLIAEILARQGIDYEVRNAQIGQHRGRLLFTRLDNVPVTLFETASTGGGWQNDEEVATFLTACDLFLAKNRPDVVWTYGGDPVSVAVQRLAKRRDIPILFALHNFAYNNPEAFRHVDYVTVPAEYSRRYYWDKLGLACQILPNVVNWDAAYVAKRNPAYVTFINPQTLKGVRIFARIARELARRRPDIPILVTQGRSAENALAWPELELQPLIRGQLRDDGTLGPAPSSGDGESPQTITVMPFLPDPKAFYPQVFSISKLLLMPSLWEESFGLVAAEAMLNGIPVLASNRGALPDTLGQGGFTFDIPAKYTPETRIVPTAEEVEPWIKTIIRLWDDAAFYERASQNARKEAERWHPDRIAPLYRDFFGSITHQPAPPVVPKEMFAENG